MEIPSQRPGTIETDEVTEVVRALEEAVEHLRRVEEDAYQWKWVLLGFHSGLQGLMVLALQDRDFANVLVEQDRKAWIAWLQNPEDPLPSSMYLDLFLNFYRRIQGEDMDQSSDSQPWKPDAHHNTAVRRLHGFRNELMHFVPQSWIFTTREIAQMVNTSADVCEFLLHQSGNVHIYETEMRDRAARALDELRETTDRILQE